jgi:hypothetical protein
MPTRAEVYAAIDSERAYQHSRAVKADGTDQGEHQHTTEEFVLYMEDYLHEARNQASRHWTPGGKTDPVSPALHTLRKVIALGVACMEQNGAPKREGF